MMINSQIESEAQIIRMNNATIEYRNKQQKQIFGKHYILYFLEIYSVTTVN